MVNSSQLCNYLRYYWRDRKNIRQLSQEVGIAQSYLYAILEKKKDKNMSIDLIGKLSDSIGKRTSEFIAEVEEFNTNPSDFQRRRLQPILGVLDQTPPGRS
jgi:transcriptional regulator with XRE-family HTH domain